MQPSRLFLSIIAATLVACGGSGGDTSPVNPQMQTPITPPPPAKIPPASGEIRTGQTSLGELRIAPNRAERPSPSAQAQLNIAIATTNRLRAEVGEAPLQVDENLSAYAAVRAKESATYFEHTRPNGQDALALELFSGYGIIGENLAAGDDSPQRTVARQWRNSPGHYKNIIRPEFSRIGMGYYYVANDRYRHYWTQIFAGDGDITSIFRFITPLRRDAALAAINQAVRYDADHHVHITIPARNQQDSLSYAGRHGIFSTPHSSAINQDHRLLLRPLHHAGWSYQTFGEITDSSGIPEAYINIGKPFVPDTNHTLQALYQGHAIGDLGQHSRVIADVRAKLDFSGAQKTLALTLYNSQLGRRDLESARPSALNAAPSLDFSDTLRWDGNKEQFRSPNGSAQLYGPNAAELGGQFQRKVNHEDYRGAYGAIRTQ